MERIYCRHQRGTPFELEPLKLKTQALICFEDVFPQLASAEVKQDTDVLVNLTNDGWFGESAAQWQQAASGLFRAVENHVPLIRCSNNGLTCWVDDRGVLREVFRDENGSVYGKGVLAVQIPLPAEGSSHQLTFYTRHGDWFRVGVCRRWWNAVGRPGGATQITPQLRFSLITIKAVCITIGIQFEIGNLQSVIQRSVAFLRDFTRPSSTRTFAERQTSGTGRGECPT